jgi:mRNA-degrading endonuclease toxin of MazEF toxin-antitoxin module
VLLGKEEGLQHKSIANMDSVPMISKSLLGQRIGRLKAGREVEIKRALEHALDWPALKMI